MDRTERVLDRLGGGEPVRVRLFEFEFLGSRDVFVQIHVRLRLDKRGRRSAEQMYDSMERWVRGNAGRGSSVVYEPTNPLDGGGGVLFTFIVRNHPAVVERAERELVRRIRDALG